MKSLTIIHYQPLEWYPPTMNMLNFLEENSAAEIKVFTHANHRNKQVYHRKNVNIFRQSYPADFGIVRRVISYFLFTIKVFFSLCTDKPEQIFYYETNSALPVFLYFKLMGFRDSSLYIHYHEYNSPEQYKEGMKLVDYSYKKEKKFLWKHANWISHTNSCRADFFQSDYPFLSNINVLPNYPPKKWMQLSNRNRENSFPLRIVYVGSLGLDNFYLKEITEWVDYQKGKVILDIYSSNQSKSSLDFFEDLNSKYINVDLSGIWYYNLPEVLAKYHVGLILYKGFNKNFIFNETNKLFEYLSCGLDVWFSEETKGIYHHITKNSYPKVQKIDYNRFHEYSLEDLIDRKGLTYKSTEYSCESVYAGFLEVLNGDHKI